LFRLAAWQNARQPWPDIDGIDSGGAIEDRPQNDFSFQARQRGADAEVRAFAKGDVPLATRPIKPEFVRRVELRRITVRRSPQQQ